MATRSTRIREAKPDRIARGAGVPEAQLGRASFTIVDVANHSEADQRHAVRSRQMRTVRRKTKIEKLRDALVISPREALACEWYQAAYEEHYETRVKIADWSATGGCSNRAYGHWPHGTTMKPGTSLLDYARQAINPAFLPMFERVVLHGRPLGKLAITFRTAARQLLEQIEGEVAL